MGTTESTQSWNDRMAIRGRRWLPLVTLVAVCLSGARRVEAQQNPHGVLPIAGSPDPFLLLLHDSLVHSELKLTPSKRDELRLLCDELDPGLWRTRNQQPAAATKIRKELKRKADARLAEILSPEQRLRLTEIERRTIGISVLLREDMQEVLQLSDTQRSSIGRILRETQASVETASAKVKKGTSRAEVETEVQELHAQSQAKVIAELSETQMTALRKALGARIDVAGLGKIRLRAPEFPASSRQEVAWINSEPQKLSDLQGDVVVVFVWTHSCINCIHNYPWYLGWQEDFTSRGVKIIGVHTPELESDRDLEAIRRKTKETGFEFPVVVDNDREIWNAWGNSMWPSTYVIDRQGYVRAWWLGELNWEGQKGEQLLRKKIEELLDE